MKRRAFTLIELLVVVAIIALLISILLPTLKSARQRARTTVCLSQMRSLELAHQIYMAEWNNWFVDVGLAHGSGAGLDPEASWVKTLEECYGQELICKSPVDDSPHWPSQLGGQDVPVPGVDVNDPNAYPYRRTSYGMNNVLSRAAAPFNPKTHRKFDYSRMEKIMQPTLTVHFVYMAEEGDFAGADHTHVENWQPGLSPQVTPMIASQQLELNAHGGPPESYESVSTYGFLDGHAEVIRFGDVWTDMYDNRFWPDAVYGTESD